MTEKIQTRPFQFGNEKESTWPPLNGTRDAGHFWWHSDCQKMLPYPPKRIERLSEAPMFISDSMDRVRHPKTGEMVDSRSRWSAIDKATGCVTTGPNELAHTKRTFDPKKADEEMVGRIKKATAMIDAGTAPLSELTRERCKQQNELISSSLGMDASNVLGKKNARRKR